MPRWADEPFKNALSPILKSIALDSSNAGGQGNNDLFIGVSLLPTTGAVMVLLTPQEPAGPPEGVLAWRLFKGGKTRFTAIREFNSPELAAAEVPDWLRG